ncbi:MAG: hypothetical protein CMO81_08125 [Waddliaceae bacterium]|nr:hypothetical protein [Waddliaceae bacterium]
MKELAGKKMKIDGGAFAVCVFVEDQIKKGHIAKSDFTEHRAHILANTMLDTGYQLTKAPITVEIEKDNSVIEKRKYEVSTVKKDDYYTTQIKTYEKADSKYLL